MALTVLLILFTSNYVKYGYIGCTYSRERRVNYSGIGTYIVGLVQDTKGTESEFLFLGLPERKIVIVKEGEPIIGNIT